MRKNSFAIGLFFLVVVGGTFSAAILRKKFTQGFQVRQTSKAPAVSQEMAPKTAEPKAVFYTSVGGSSNTNEAGLASEQISNRYTIEVAQVGSQTEAEQILLKMRSRGVDGFYTPVRRGGHVIYRIRLGVYANADDATKSLAKIAGSANINGRVARLQ